MTNAGVVNARGGRGGDFAGNAGVGAGAGGGIVHFLAPEIDSAGGTVAVTGGQPGNAGVGVVTSTRRSGGGGGGACGGAGAHGGTVSTDNNANISNKGQPGYALESLLDPTSLF